MRSPDSRGELPPSFAVRPGRTLPGLYAALAHAALLFALARVLVAPEELATFPSSPRFAAVVHLVTLGFLASAVYGAIYGFAPSVLRLPISERRSDFAAFALHAAGTMALSFGLAAAEPRCAAIGGAAALAGGAWVVGRLLAGLPRTGVPPGTRSMIGSSAVFFLVAGGLGVFFAWARIYGLPGTLERSSVIAAHAHLAVFGWLTGTLFGFGSRMLPMLFAARPGSGRDLFWIAALHGGGALGLAVALLFFPAAVPLSAGVAALAVLAFLAHAAAMARRRVRPAVFRHGFDPTRAHAALALVALTLATALGVAIALRPESQLLRRAIVSYGILALLGFLAQMVFAVVGLLAPAYAWIRRAAAMSPEESQPALDFRASLPFLRAVLAGWGGGIPLLVAGSFLARLAVVRAGAALLLAATFASALHLLVLALVPAARRAAPTR